MKSSVGPSGVLDKVTALLDVLEDGPAPLAELVVRTGISRATVHRLATDLVRRGLVRRDDEGRFALGARLIALGRAAAEDWPLAAAAMAALSDLREASGESVQLFVREGEERVCIAALQSVHGLRTIVPLGARLPIGVGSAGKVLGGVDDELFGDWIESVGEREAGVASVSAPVRDADGAIVAAVSVSGPIERTSREPGRRYGALVVEAARRIEIDAALR